ncbi:glycosyltransferase [Ensifer adhaerens]|uniref:glycosyltransferase n=2 Tax=Sinorhizobium/Ensifer group TaxID=227292 RepID=UPI001F3A794A|nr:glycosyltransferase [Ensifer adhaerens]
MGFRHPVAPYMCAVDILLVPAMSEPFGRTLIEAMMYGTPVVATNHGGNPEAIENNVTGFLVEPENPEAFVAPMEHLLKDRNEWQRISETARTSTLAAYGIKPHVDGIVSIYQRILGRRPSDISAHAAH